MINLTFTVNKQVLTRTDSEIVASNSNKVHKCTFEFSEEWDSTVKTATFKKDGIVYSAILDENNSCYIPTGVLKSSDNMTVYVGVYGIGEDITITSNLVAISVIKGTALGGVNSVITPTMYEQIMAKIAEIEAGEFSTETVEQVIADYLAKNPIEGISEQDVLNVLSEYAIPISISATKDTTIYSQGDEISLNDLVVNVTFADGTTKEVVNYNTNIEDIETFTAGLKRLTIDYYGYGKKVSTTINLNVNFDESYDGLQYAYKVANAGAIRNGVNLLGLSHVMYKYTDFNLKLKLKLTVEQNTNTEDTTIYVGNSSMFSGNLGNVIVGAGEVGEFEITVDKAIYYNKSNVYVESDTVPLLYLYHNGGAYISGMFEITDCSLALTSEILERPVSITATKANKYFVQGEDVEITDITATVTFNIDTTRDYGYEDLNVVTKNVDINSTGDQNINVQFTQNGITVSKTLVMHYFSADKTEPDDFTEMTASEWYNSWNYGINLGNCLDPYGSSLQPSGTGDAWINEQETHWWQPKLTQRNIQEVADAGFEMVRLPITWYCNSYLDDNGVRHMGKWWMYRVKEIVDWCLDAGLKVLINTHHDSKYVFDLGLTDDAAVLEKCNLAKEFWTDIANKFKYHNQNLAFEGFNEIDNLKNSWVVSADAQLQMNQLNQAFVDAVRATGENNEKRILVCPFLIHRNAKLVADNYVCPTDASDSENEISNYIGTAVHWYPTTWNQSIDNMMGQIEGFMTETGVPIMINEYGLAVDTSDSSNHANRLMYYPNYIARAKQHRIKTVIWDNGTEYNVVRKYNTTSATNSRGISPITQEQSEELVAAISNGYVNSTAYKIPDEQVHVFDSFDNMSSGTITSAGELKSPFSDWTYMFTDPIECSVNQTISIICNQSSERANTKGLYLYAIAWYNSSGTFMSLNTSVGGYGKKNVTVTITENASFFRAVFYVAMGPKMVTQEDQQSYLFDNGDSMVISVFNSGDESAVVLGDRVPYQIKSCTLIEDGLVDSEGNITQAPKFNLDILYDEGNSHLMYYAGSRTNLGNVEIYLPTIEGKGIYEFGVNYTYNNVTLTKTDTGITFKYGKWMNTFTATISDTTYNISEMTSEEIQAAITSDIVATATYTDGTSEDVTSSEYVSIGFSGVAFGDAGTYDINVYYDDGVEQMETTVSVTFTSNDTYKVVATYTLAYATEWLTTYVNKALAVYTEGSSSYKIATQIQGLIDGNVGTFTAGGHTYVYNGKIVYCEEDGLFYMYLTPDKYSGYWQYIKNVTLATEASSISTATKTPVNVAIKSTGAYTDSQARVWYVLDNMVTVQSDGVVSMADSSRGIISIASQSDIDNLEI